MYQLKNKVKKQPLVDKMAKADDMKKLQQQVAKLRTKQQKRTDRVTKLQAEVEKFTEIIQPVE